MSEILHLPALYTEAEVAERMGISKTTLQRARRQGLIRYRRIGSGNGSIRYTLDDLWDYYDRVQEGGWQTRRKEREFSDPIGFLNVPVATTTTAPGSTPPLDRLAASRLAQATFRKPNRGSLNTLSKLAKSSSNPLLK